MKPPRDRHVQPPRDRRATPPRAQAPSLPSSAPLPHPPREGLQAQTPLRPRRRGAPPAKAAGTGRCRFLLRRGRSSTTRSTSTFWSGQRRSGVSTRCATSESSPGSSRCHRLVAAAWPQRDRSVAATGMATTSPPCHQVLGCYPRDSIIPSHPNPTHPIPGARLLPERVSHPRGGCYRRRPRAVVHGRARIPSHPAEGGRPRLRHVRAVPRPSVALPRPCRLRPLENRRGAPSHTNGMHAFTRAGHHTRCVHAGGHVADAPPKTGARGSPPTAKCQSFDRRATVACDRRMHRRARSPCD